VLHYLAPHHSCSRTRGTQNQAFAERRSTGVLHTLFNLGLAEVVETGPIPAAHGVVRWRLADLAQWVWDEFEVSITRHTLGRELRAMGYRKLSARPRHRGQKDDDIAIFKKASPPVWRKSAKASPKERP
jgi:hypothetical protein